MSADDSVVLVDMDGVLADFDRAVLDGLPADLVRMDRSNFYIARDYPDHVSVVKAIYDHPDFFYRLHPVEDAMVGWQRLIDLGYHPRICSAPLTSNERTVEGKRAWLEQHFVPVFGSRVVDEAIIDKRKFNHHGLALIDDRPDLDTGGGRASWRHVVFDRPYNKTSSAELRVRGWTDPRLGEVLSAAARR